MLHRADIHESYFETSVSRLPINFWVVFRNKGVFCEISNKNEIHVQSQHLSSRLKHSKFNTLFNDVRHICHRQFPLLIYLFTCFTYQRQSQFDNHMTVTSDIAKQGMSDWPGNGREMASHSYFTLRFCERLSDVV